MRILFCGECFPAARGLLSERVAAMGDEVLVCNGAGLREAMAHADVVIPLMSIVDEELMQAGCFRLVQQWGSGLEGVDLDAARARGIWAANVPTGGSNANSVAEHVILLILALLRRLRVAVRNVSEGVVGAPLGQMLAGRTVCLYGLGTTARALAWRLRALGVRLIGITRESGAEKAAEFRLDACFGSKDRCDALAETEVLVICVRLACQTRGLIGASELKALPAGAYVVNAARGGLIDYQALFDALASGHLGGAGLDVFWTEPFPAGDALLSFPNVIATPHVAGVTERSYAEIADVVAGNLERFRRGEPPLNRAA